MSPKNGSGILALGIILTVVCVSVYAHGIEHPIMMTVATTDGTAMWVFRYFSERNSRSLFHSTDVETLRAQYPGHPVLHTLSAEMRLIVSEPLGDLAGAWNELSETT